MIRVVLPPHLRKLSGAAAEVQLDVPAPVTQRSVIDAIEAAYPVLRGTIRDHGSDRRRPLIRLYACEQDISHDAPDTPLPAAVAAGQEPFLVIASIAGG